MKAARKEELSPRLTVQGQALLQASRAATRAVQPTAASMREAYLLSLSLKCAPQLLRIVHDGLTFICPHISCSPHLPGPVMCSPSDHIMISCPLGQ